LVLIKTSSGTYGWFHPAHSVEFEYRPDLDRAIFG